MSGVVARQGVPPDGLGRRAKLRSDPHAVAAFQVHALSEMQRRTWFKESAGVVDLHTIVRTLTAKKIPFVVTGAHGFAGWAGLVRATMDVDVLVKAGRNHARAVKAIHELYPQLECRTFTGVTAFFVPGNKQALIDIIYPHSPDLEETLATAIWVEDEGTRYRVPALEAVLANKYGAMLNLTRPLAKRGQDAIDFLRIVQFSDEPGQQPLNLKRLEELGEMVWPQGGGAEILSLVAQVKAGQVPTLPTAH